MLDNIGIEFLVKTDVEGLSLVRRGNTVDRVAWK